MTTETVANVTSSTTTVCVLTSPGHGDQNRLSQGLVPIELQNGCTEEGCIVDSDDTNLTNTIRRHFLEHFGHRDLEGMVCDYAQDAVMWHVVNGKTQKYQGHNDIRAAFQGIFALHPAGGASSFQLKQIVVKDRIAMAYWTAKTPHSSFSQCTDTFVFDDTGKIKTKFFSCAINQLTEK